MQPMSSTPRTQGRWAKTRWSFLGLALALIGASCRSASGDASSVVEGTYFTQYSLRVEKGLTRSTNYRTDRIALLVPVNTEVEVLGRSGKYVNARVAGGAEFKLEHVAKHTQDSMSEAFDKVFGAEPVDLSAFSEEEKDAILDGRALVGMTKEGVLAGMGPPPAVGTLSRDSDTWKYWNTRFTTFDVRFDEEGRVTSIGN